MFPEAGKFEVFLFTLEATWWYSDLRYDELASGENDSSAGEFDLSKFNYLRSMQWDPEGVKPLSLEFDSLKLVEAL